MAYTYEKPDNLVELIETSVQRFADNPLFGVKSESGDYQWLTYRDVGQRIDYLRAGLAQVGVGAGDAVGIIANNRPEWAIAAFAAFGLRARFIPMYQMELQSVWRHIIADSRIKVLLVADAEIKNQVLAFSDQTPELRKIYVIDDTGPESMPALERKGRANPVPSMHPSPQDIAVLIYTSGTTGNPKGVLLSHGNFTTNFIAGRKCYPQLNQSSRSLSILPWAHSFGQTGELYNFIQFGGSIGFMGNVNTLVDDMQKVQPTFLIAVPRVFNKIHSSLWAKINAAGGLPRKLFVMGLEAARRRREAQDGQPVDFGTRLRLKIADALVFKKIRSKFGGQLEGAVTGSATMNVEIGHFFADIGIPVYDCYGLTETSPAVTMNCPKAHKPGSVGRPIEQVKVVIDRFEGQEDGEVIVYGPNVMQGYHNNPEATHAVMTSDGGFKTGDRGRLDEDGFLYITGRIKEQYKLENGKYVFPTHLEEEIKLLPCVENAMIFGEGRAYNIVLIVPDFEFLTVYAKENDVPPEVWQAPQALVNHSEIQEYIQRTVIEALAGKFGGYEIPKRFVLLSEPFALENGMLTQTMKLKRRAVIERYMKDIEAAFETA
jgi:long-chain acyl-CoA synthetase